MCTAVDGTYVHTIQYTHATALSPGKHLTGALCRGKAYVSELYMSGRAALPVTNQDSMIGSCDSTSFSCKVCDAHSGICGLFGVTLLYVCIFLQCDTKATRQIDYHSGFEAR